MTVLATPITTIGMRLPTVVSPPISPSTLALVADESDCYFPFHSDSVTAKVTGFGDSVAYSVFATAYLGRMLTDWVPQHQIRRFAVWFLTTPPAGAQFACTGVVASISSVHGERRAQIDMSASTEQSVRVVCGEAVVALSDLPSLRELRRRS